MNEITLAANPYCCESSYFFFDSYDEYETKYDHQYEKLGTEEYEFDFIEGSDQAYALWNILKPTQCTLREYFEIYESGNFDCDEDILKFKICIQVLLLSPSDALNRYEDVYLYEGSPEDYVQDYYDEHYEIPSYLDGYIDYEKIAHDWECNGSIIHYVDEGFVHVNPDGL